MDFIFNGNVPEPMKKCLFVCAHHFQPHCFTNLGQYNAGLAARLALDEGSVPTIRGKKCVTEKKSTNDGGRMEQFFSRHVACQTVFPKLLSVGTQLSLKTLQGRVRSKGTQVGPCKRTQVEEGDSLEDDPHLSRRRPKDKAADLDLTELADEDTESSSSASNAVLKRPAYIVYEDCLLELFKVCPKCERASDVKTCRLGTELSVQQLCPHCNFCRKWDSQPRNRNLLLSAAGCATDVALHQT